MQRYFSNQKNNNFLILTNEDLYHIKIVMRMKEKDLIEVVYDNELYICQLDNNYNANILEKKEKLIIKDKKYILCIPLLTDQKMSLVLQKSTELGIDKIIPINTIRSKVKVDLKEEKKLQRWNKICKEASEQSKRLDIPKIDKITNLKDLDINGLKIVCSTVEKNQTLKKVLRNNKNYDTIVIVVGPEGGLALEEEELLIKKGFIPVSLGNNILRVETVPLSILSMLNYEFME